MLFSPEAIRCVWFSSAQLVDIKRFKVAGRKKTARLAGGFSGISGAFLCALTPLSIRQRSEMPEKIKVKLGGHGEKE
jgi:hypothetical protein